MASAAGQPKLILFSVPGRLPEPLGVFYLFRIGTNDPGTNDMSFRNVVASVRKHLADVDLVISSIEQHAEEKVMRQCASGSNAWRFELPAKSSKAPVRTDKRISAENVPDFHVVCLQRIFPS
jgi:hypothetical protein